MGMRTEYRVFPSHELIVLDASGRLDLSQTKEAIRTLKKVLSKPGPLTFSLIEMDPKWEPLRNHAGYKSLEKKLP